MSLWNRVLKFGIITIASANVISCDTPSAINDAGNNLNSIVCDAPYIRHQDDCCLDENNNRICDNDESINDLVNGDSDNVNEPQQPRETPYEVGLFCVENALEFGAATDLIERECTTFCYDVGTQFDWNRRMEDECVTTVLAVLGNVDDNSGNMDNSQNDDLVDVGGGSDEEIMEEVHPSAFGRECIEDELNDGKVRGIARQTCVDGCADNYSFRDEERCLESMDSILFGVYNSLIAPYRGQTGNFIQSIAFGSGDRYSISPLVDNPEAAKFKPDGIEAKLPAQTELLVIFDDPIENVEGRNGNDFVALVRFEGPCDEVHSVAVERYMGRGEWRRLLNGQVYIVGACVDHFLEFDIDDVEGGLDENDLDSPSNEFIITNVDFGAPALYVDGFVSKR